MYDHKIPHRQLTAWLSAALIPAAVQLTAGASWLSVLLVVAFSLLCIWIRWTFGAEPQGKTVALLQLVLTAVILGMAAQCSIQSWPRGGHPAVAVVLLGLAVWSVWKGSRPAARVGCVLFWFVLILYLVLLGAGIKDVRLQWLTPTKGDVNAFGSVLLLIPAGAAIHLNSREGFKPRLLLVGAFCVVAAVVTAGVLSPQVAAGKQNAFHEMTRSLNLLGQARRFEAVLSAGMTVGWFCIFSLCLTLCARLAEKLRPGRGKWGVIGAGVVALTMLLCELHIPGIVLLISCAVFWVLIPLITQGLGIKKKS